MRSAARSSSARRSGSPSNCTHCRRSWASTASSPSSTPAGRSRMTASSTRCASSVRRSSRLFIDHPSFPRKRESRAARPQHFPLDPRVRGGDGFLGDEPMRFGLFGGARTDPGEQASDSRIYGDYVDYICEAEALGFHSVFLVEHHFTGFGQISATLNFLTFLAAKTTTLRLGTAVLVLPWHNPALLAEQAATLDLLSNGRFDFGIGKGYRWGEFHGFCMKMDEAEERYQETVAFLKKAWTGQTRFSHHGKYWDYDDVVIEPAPVQKPHPPLWVGAQSPNSIRYAADNGFNLLLGQAGTPEVVAEGVAVYRRAVE